MSAVGLTKAQESGLKYIRGDHNRMPTERVFRALYEAGLCAPGGGQLTPRGHAALAAPRVTPAELEYMEFVDAGNWRTSFSSSGSRARWQCIEKRWIQHFPGASDRLTPSGRKALNDIRAAMGSELYKETM